MDMYFLRISIAEWPCMDIPAWMSMWISIRKWIIQDWHPKIMDIYVDIRGFLEMHVWICCGFSDQGDWVQHDTVSRRATQKCRPSTTAVSQPFKSFAHLRSSSVIIGALGVYPRIWLGAHSNLRHEPLTVIRVESKRSAQSESAAFA